jgi:hypothetical protein
MADWYFERWKPDGEHAHITEVTADFPLVFAQCLVCLRAGEIFRVRPPIGADDDQMQQLARLGTIERI